MHGPAIPLALAVVLLPLSAALTACATSGQGAAPDLTGCHYFEQDAQTRALGLPWGIRLTDEPIDGWPLLEGRDARAAWTLTPEAERDHPFGYWLRTAEDSLEVGHPGGGGIVLELTVDGQTLRGTARSAGDVIVLDGPDPSGRRPVSLQRAECPGY